MSLIAAWAKDHLEVAQDSICIVFPYILFLPVLLGKLIKKNHRREKLPVEEKNSFLGSITVQ